MDDDDVLGVHAGWDVPVMIGAGPVLATGFGVAVMNVGSVVTGDMLGDGGGGGFTVLSPAIPTATSGPITAASRATTEGTTIWGFRHHGSSDKLNAPFRACSEPSARPGDQCPDDP